METILQDFSGLNGVSLLFANPLIKVYEHKKDKKGNKEYEERYYVVPSRLNGYALVCKDHGCSEIYGLFRRCASCEKVYGLDFCLIMCNEQDFSTEKLKVWFAEKSINLLNKGWFFEAGCSIGPYIPAEFLDNLNIYSVQDILWFKRGGSEELVVNKSWKVFRIWRLFKALTINTRGTEEYAEIYSKIAQRPIAVKRFDDVMVRLKTIVEAIRDSLSRYSITLYTPIVEIREHTEENKNTEINIKISKLGVGEASQENTVNISNYLNGLKEFSRWAEQHSFAITPETRLIVEPYASG